MRHGPMAMPIESSRPAIFAIARTDTDAGMSRLGGAGLRSASHFTWADQNPLEASASVPVIDEIKVQETKNLNRVNRFFLNRVNMLLDNLKQRPRNTGTHAYIYSILMRLYPYLNQQTAIQEHELTTKLEQIILSRYNNDKSQVSALHRSIAKAKEHQLNLIELINKTAKIKI